MIRADLSTATDMELVFADKTLSVPYSSFMGIQPDMTDPVQAQQVCDAIRDWIYTQLDVRTRRNQLPQSDPRKGTDPATEAEFWDGSDLVFRPYIIAVAWDGERFQYGFRVAR